MSRRPLWKICCLLAAGFLTLLSGCMVGPKYSRPKTAADTNDGFFEAGSHIEDVNALDRMHRWWERFGDKTTTELVLKALQNNYDLKAAAARVLQAQALLKQSKAPLLPDVSYGLDRTRNKFSFNFGGGRASALTTSYTQSFSVNYLLDLFGKLRHAERASWADLLAAEANRQALVNSIIASVVTSRVQIATLERRLEIARANTASRRNTLEIVERRYAQGLVGPVDVRLARENLAASEAAEPAIELSLAIAQHALDVLLGERPGSSARLPRTLADLPNLEPIPIGLPASLLDRRPDLVASELQLRAANERIGVSIAQLFPDLTLTGSLGRSAEHWRDIWIPETEIYSAVIRVAQPIFQGGRLKAQAEASKAQYEELAADYAKAVLNALKEVEDALVSEQKLQSQLAHVEYQLTEAMAAEDLSRQRYQRGLESILTVLDSERRRRLAEEQLAVLKGQLWTNRISLFLALGGDWTSQERAEDESRKAHPDAG